MVQQQPGIIDKIGNIFKTIFSKTYFPRFIIFILVIGAIFILMFNIKCNKKDGVVWEPAGKININKQVKP